MAKWTVYRQDLLNKVHTTYPFYLDDLPTLPIIPRLDDPPEKPILSLKYNKAVGYDNIPAEFVVVSSSHHSPSLGVLLFWSAQSVYIICIYSLCHLYIYAISTLLSVWSASRDSRKGGGCHAANDHSRCALLGRFCSCTDQGFVMTGEQLCQFGSCLPWECLFGCSNGRRSAIEQF